MMEAKDLSVIVIGGGALAVIAYLLIDAFADWMRRKREDRQTTELFGERHEPNPVKASVSVDEALRLFEKALTQNSYSDSAWTITNSDAASGALFANSSTHTVRHYGRASIEYTTDDEIYLEAQLKHAPESGGSIVTWKHTVKSKCSMDFAIKQDETVKTHALINKTNACIREALGAPTIALKTDR